ncbi:unnamed protein product [Symbiodinium microadriaticum]|nr:unnamed protein product [Symbiodinium microadriaticum]
MDSAGEKIVWTGMDGGKGRDSTKNSHGRDDGKSIALASITEVAEGCETAALSGVPVNRQSYCFTVYSSDRELDVEMEDSATRAVWVKNIRQIMLADRVIAGMEAVGKPRLARQQRPSTIIRKTNLKDAMSKARQHTMPQAHI